MVIFTKKPNASVRQHNEEMGHTQYQDWCAHCVLGRATGELHRRVEVREEGRFPFVGRGGCFMRNGTIDVFRTRFCVKQPAPKQRLWVDEITVFFFFFGRGSALAVMSTDIVTYSEPALPLRRAGEGLSDEFSKRESQGDPRAATVMCAN